MSQPKKPSKAPSPERATHYALKSMAQLPAGQERIRLFLNIQAAQEQKPGEKSWIGEVLPHLTLVSASPPAASSSSSGGGAGASLTFKFDVGHIHSNAIGNMQGGCISTVFDYTTSLALAMINKPGFWFFLGVTRTLTVTVVRPVAVGQTVVIEVEVVHAGKRLAHLKGTMRRESDGALLAVCEHDKVNSDPPEEVLKQFLSGGESKL